MDSIPNMVFADDAGNIIDDPDLAMCCRKGGQWGMPQKDELIPVPDESELMLLPGRRPIGADPLTGQLVLSNHNAVAAFVAPAYTISAHPLYIKESDAKVLPLFAYGAVGYARGRFWVCAKQMDQDKRQQFRNIPVSRIKSMTGELLKKYSKNRLLVHILKNCAERYNCPAARNFILGRYEAPLPTSRACSANCIGCISAKSKDSPLVATPQCRIEFIPSAEEIAEIMRIHSQREKKAPVLSFGQGCEGDPLVNAELLAESMLSFRHWQKNNLNRGVTLNCNTNAFSPNGVELLAKSGLSSMRVSLNSCQEDLYNEYYRPFNYTFKDVENSIAIARQNGIYISLNLLFFPGVTDTENELEALARLVSDYRINMIQWRNLNIDPDWYNDIMRRFSESSAICGGMGLKLFSRRIKKMCPWTRHGYFNPYIGDRADSLVP